ncbi:ABC transporter permease [Uliginosibacterium sp. H1]|uniref:ABC transporter permease n=1 Tax=Uliginosibacterium sp. H1 TaxID=3114757 RepID=UPI002E180788|nr:FtsX-like permease family protein [Uliginosibacterium sp. H1]
MNLLDLAWRNLLRNRRRSLLTLGALCVGAMAVVIFGGYVAAMINVLQTDTVRDSGHLQIMRKGFLDFGRGNPERFAIRDYPALINRIADDPELKPMLRVATPILRVQGVAGNFAAGASSTYAGTGWQVAERDRMLGWDGNDLGLPPRANRLQADQPESGVIGLGLAQLLSMCQALELRDCAMPPAAATQDDAPAIDASLSQLAAQSNATTTPADATPAIELLSATSGGAPSVVRMQVLRTERQGVRDLDMVYAAMPIALAERLVFGPEGKGASAIVVQLEHTEQIPAARARIEKLLADFPGGADMEVRDFKDVQPQYNQVVNMFSALFQFIALLMGAVTLFSVANAVGMSVGERVGEIGTLRSMGFKRRHVRRMFILEGALIGTLGAVIGAVAGALLGEYGINQAGITWTPPGRAMPVPVGVDALNHPELLLGTVLILALIACLSSLWPANRAAKMEIVEALRHV